MQDQFDCIDLSDNEIRKLGNFPSMTRLNTILINNNHITRIDKLGNTLLGVTSLVLTNNRVANLSEIDNIATLTKLEHLCLLDNPVAQKPNYRLYAIHRLPALKSLDFRKVAKQERDDARKYFKSVVGKAMLSDIAQEGSSADALEQGLPPPSTQAAAAGAPKPVVLTEAQKQQVREAIQSAKTKEEVDVIERKLKVGAHN